MTFKSMLVVGEVFISLLLIAWWLHVRFFQHCDRFNLYFQGSLGHSLLCWTSSGAFCHARSFPDNFALFCCFICEKSFMKFNEPYFPESSSKPSSKLRFDTSAELSAGASTEPFTVLIGGLILGPVCCGIRIQLYGVSYLSLPMPTWSLISAFIVTWNNHSAFIAVLLYANALMAQNIITSVLLAVTMTNTIFELILSAFCSLRHPPYYLKVALQSVQECYFFAKHSPGDGHCATTWMSLLLRRLVF